MSGFEDAVRAPLKTLPPKTLGGLNGGDDKAEKKP